jgi:hypothetical protein
VSADLGELSANRLGSPIDDDPLGLGDVPIDLSGDLPPMSASVCPSCGAPMSPDVVLCVACGYHKAKGQKIQAVAEPEEQTPDQESSGNLKKWRVPAIIAASILSLIAAVGLFVPVLGLVLVVAVGGLSNLVGVVGGIWLLIVAFDEDSLCGMLMLIVPFYGLYYLIDRWDGSWPFWLVAVSATGNFVAGGYLFLCSSISGI